MENLVIDERLLLDSVVDAGIIPESQVKAYGGAEGVKAFFQEKLKYQELNVILGELRN